MAEKWGRVGLGRALGVLPGAVWRAWGGCRPRASGVSPGQEATPTHFHPEPGGPREATPWLWPVGWSGLSGAQSSVGTGMDAALRAGGGCRLSHSAALCLSRSESPRSIWTTPSAPAGQPGRTIKLSADLGSGAGRQGRGASGGPSKMSLLGGLRALGGAGTGRGGPQSQHRPEAHPPAAPAPLAPGLSPRGAGH